jgi:hypothetical protein
MYKDFILSYAGELAAGFWIAGRPLLTSVFGFRDSPLNYERQRQPKPSTTPMLQMRL